MTIQAYDVIADFLGPGDKDGTTVDSISTSPYCVIAAWRYKYPATYSRKQRQSFAISPVESVALRDTVLLIVNDIRNVSINEAKTQHINSLTATLLPGMNYLSELLPGDIVAAWMVNDKASFDTVVEKLRTNGSANDFLSGLKFLGKVNSVQKNLTQAPNGTKSLVYSLTANGFTELDASIYYEPYLETSNAGVSTQFLKMTGVAINNILRDNKLGLDINKLIPVYLSAFYGPGIPQNQLTQQTGLQNTNGLDNPEAFIVPGPIANLLGVTKATKPNGLFSFVDILEVIYGIQRYNFSGGETLGTISRLQNSLNESSAWRTFTPFTMNPDDADVRQRYTGLPMIGTYLPSPPQFNGQRSVWQIIHQYLNPSINEMFTCMRVNPFGKIMPTLVVRQLPFSSGYISSEFTPKPINVDTGKKKVDGKNKNKLKSKGEDASAGVSMGGPHTVELTRMLELPRWRIHPVLIRSYNVGRSDSVRFNFMHIDADTSAASPNRTSTFVRNQPVQDQLDIMRNGFRPYMSSVSCAPADIVNRAPTDWMYILSDILFGQHLSLTGNMELYGIQAPIVPGDNIEFDDSVFHIEAVRHSFSISADGRKTFTTSLNLTHGVRAQQLSDNDLSMYTGIKQEDLGAYDPATSYESDGGEDSFERKSLLPGNIETEEEEERSRQALKQALQPPKGRTEKL